MSCHKMPWTKCLPFCSGLIVFIQYGFHGVPASKVHGTNMGAIWGRQDPGGPHVGPVVSIQLTKTIHSLSCVPLVVPREINQQANGSHLHKQDRIRFMTSSQWYLQRNFDDIYIFDGKLVSLISNSTNLTPGSRWILCVSLTPCVLD